MQEKVTLFQWLQTGKDIDKGPDQINMPAAKEIRDLFLIYREKVTEMIELFIFTFYSVPRSRQCSTSDEAAAGPPA